MATLRHVITPEVLAEIVSLAQVGDDIKFAVTYADGVSMTEEGTIKAKYKHNGPRLKLRYPHPEDPAAELEEVFPHNEPADYHMVRLKGPDRLLVWPKVTANNSRVGTPATSNRNSPDRQRTPAEPRQTAASRGVDGAPRQQAPRPPSPVTRSASAISDTSVSAADRVAALTSRRLATAPTAAAAAAHEARISDAEGALDLLTAQARKQDAATAKIRQLLERCERRTTALEEKIGTIADDVAALRTASGGVNDAFAEEVITALDKILSRLDSLETRATESARRVTGGRTASLAGMFRESDEADDAESSFSRHSLAMDRIRASNSAKLYDVATWDDHEIDHMVGRVEKHFLRCLRDKRDLEASRASACSKHIATAAAELAKTMAGLVEWDEWRSNARQVNRANRLIWAMESSIAHAAGEHDYKLCMAKFDALHPSAPAGGHPDFAKEVATVPKPRKAEYEGTAQSPFPDRRPAPKPQGKATASSPPKSGEARGAP